MLDIKTSPIGLAVVPVSTFYQQNEPIPQDEFALANPTDMNAEVPLPDRNNSGDFGLF